MYDGKKNDRLWIGVTRNKRIGNKYPFENAPLLAVTRTSLSFENIYYSLVQIVSIINRLMFVEKKL